MAGLLDRVFAFSKKKGNKPEDRSAELAGSIAEAGKVQDGLRSALQELSKQSDERQQRLRDHARNAAAALDLGGPGRRTNRPGDADRPVEERQAAVMKRGLERLSKIKASYRFALSEDDIKALASRARAHAAETAAAKKRAARKGDAAREDVAQEPVAAAAEAAEAAPSAPFELPLELLQELLRERFGNLDVVNKTVPGNRDASSKAPLDRRSKQPARPPDKEPLKSVEEKVKEDAQAKAEAKAREKEKEKEKARAKPRADAGQAGNAKPAATAGGEMAAPPPRDRNPAAAPKPAAVRTGRGKPGGKGRG